MAAKSKTIPILVLIAVFCGALPAPRANFWKEAFPLSDIKRHIIQQCKRHTKKYSSWGRAKKLTEIEIKQKVEISLERLLQMKDKPYWLFEIADELSYATTEYDEKLLFVIFDSDFIDKKKRSHRIVGLVVLYKKGNSRKIQHVKTPIITWENNDEKIDIDNELQMLSQLIQPLTT